VNGSDVPRDPDLAALVPRFAERRLATDLAAIGVPDAFAFLGHFVMAGDAVATFAGPGPLVTDDRTRLDFTVPRSLDAFFGFANAATEGWLVDLMEPGAPHDVGLAVFFRKIARMATYEEPVLPWVRNVEAAGFTIDEVRARIAAAGTSPRAGSAAASASAATR
jgi:hypothetical protein